MAAWRHPTRFAIAAVQPMQRAISPRRGVGVGRLGDVGVPLVGGTWLVMIVERAPLRSSRDWRCGWTPSSTLCRV
jgi:hypothetical protein